MVVFILSLHRSFETVSLHSASPPLSLCNGGTKALFQCREDHPRLRGSRPGKRNTYGFKRRGLSEMSGIMKHFYYSLKRQLQPITTLKTTFVNSRIMQA